MMAPSEFQQLRADFSELRGEVRDMRGDVRQLAVSVAQYAAHQAELSRREDSTELRLRAIEANCAESKARRTALETTGTHQAAELAKIKGDASHWSRWGVDKLFLLIGWIAAAIAGALLASLR